MNLNNSIAHLKGRLDQLEERERKLLLIFLGVLGVMILVLVPLAVAMSVSEQSAENERVREIISSIVDERVTLGRRQAEKERVANRYKRKAPELSGYLAKTAEKAGVEIPETQDRSTVPHGKAFNERITKISLRKVGMLKLSNFLEKIENSGYPLSISRLKIRKHSSKPDVYDAEIEVSAFDREVKAPSKDKGKNKSADDEDDDMEEKK